MESTRLDKYLTDHHYFPSREKSAEAIRQQRVKVNGIVIHKPSHPVKTSDSIDILRADKEYVSKGGDKLEKAIREFSIDFTGKTVLDAGASTGGFTDCALQHGAKLVAAVDVGTGQLAEKLQQHPQVFSLEKTDIRELKAAQLPIGVFDIVVADLSFISLEKVLDVLVRFCKPSGEMILLVKPQFEQQQRVNVKKGIIKDAKLREAILSNILKLLERFSSATPRFCETEIQDYEEKNIEYLIYIKM